jgi:hypothetical protein
MIDPDKINADETYGAVWGARINGVVSGSSTANTNSRITQRINDAYAQSPYLGRINDAYAQSPYLGAN